MDVHLTADREARLQRLSARTGKDATMLVEEAIDRMLDYDAAFLEAVEAGRASARRGDLLEHEAVVDRIDRVFRS